MDWLRQVGDEIRNQRLAPLAEQATAAWHQLRHDSNVELESIRLSGNKNQRRLELNVAVDDARAAALGVMSQGELHSLALSLFLPRATLADSPLRFLVIDDPVQAMDPAKVYGLARLLADVARTRQVVVFTHDDRLPNAVRQLQIDAHLRVVHRRERSQVTVQAGDDPARRYLADARAVVRDEYLDQPQRGAAVAALAREALEAACHDRIRRVAARSGRSLAEVEQQLADPPKKLFGILALALQVDPRDHGQVRRTLNKLHPRAERTVKTLNKGNHPNELGERLDTLVDDADALVRKLEEVR